VDGRVLEREVPRYWTSASAMKFIMIVLITSCAPTFALRIAGNSAHSAAAAMPASSVSGSRERRGPVAQRRAHDSRGEGTDTSCPSAPMLNRPARNASATASPVKISGVARNSTWPMP
jgi:hypothetical protein